MLLLKIACFTYNRFCSWYISATNNHEHKGEPQSFHWEDRILRLFLVCCQGVMLLQVAQKKKNNNPTLGNWMGLRFPRLNGETNKICLHYFHSCSDYQLWIQATQTKILFVLFTDHVMQSNLVNNHQASTIFSQFTIGIIMKPKLGDICKQLIKQSASVD